MIALHYKKKVYLLPQQWNELSRSQLCAIMKVLFSNVDEIKGRLQMLKILAGMSWWTFLKFPQEELARWLELTDFILTKNTLTNQVIPCYKNFHGPAGGLDNLKMKEFVFSELYYAKFDQGKEDEALDDLIAVLYRPARKSYNKKLNPDGDIREDFNENMTNQYAKAVHRWPIEVRRAILTFYAGCRMAWVEQFSDVFGGGDGDADASKYGLWSMMRNVAKQGIFGNFDRVQEQFVTSVLMDLDETVAEARRLKDSIKTT